MTDRQASRLYIEGVISGIKLGGAIAREQTRLERLEEFPSLKTEEEEDVLRQATEAIARAIAIAIGEEIAEQRTKLDLLGASR